MDFMRLLPADYAAKVSVAYEEVEIEEETPPLPYPAGHKWAEPSVADAARAMNAVAGDLAGVKKQAAAAAEILRREFSVKARGAAQAARLAAITQPGPVPDNSPICYWLKNRDVRAVFAGMDDVVAHWVKVENVERPRGCEYVSTTAYHAAVEHLGGRAPKLGRQRSTSP